MFCHDLKIRMSIWIFNYHIFDKIMAVCQLWQFPPFESFDVKRFFFGGGGGGRGIGLIFDVMNIRFMIQFCYIYY